MKDHVLDISQTRVNILNHNPWKSANANNLCKIPDEGYPSSSCFSMSDLSRPELNSTFFNGIGNLNPRAETFIPICQRRYHDHNDAQCTEMPINKTLNPYARLFIHGRSNWSTTTTIKPMEENIRADHDSFPDYNNNVFVPHVPHATALNSENNHSILSFLESNCSSPNILDLSTPIMSDESDIENPNATLPLNGSPNANPQALNSKSEKCR